MLHVQSVRYAVGAPEAAGEALEASQTYPEKGTSWHSKLHQTSSIFINSLRSNNYEELLKTLSWFAVEPFIFDLFFFNGRL